MTSRSHNPLLPKDLRLQADAAKRVEALTFRQRAATLAARSQSVGAVSLRSQTPM